MGTLLNRRRYMGGKSLPYDYEVEYIRKTNKSAALVAFPIYGNMGTDAVEITFTNTTIAVQDIYIGDVSGQDSRGIRFYINGSGKYAFFSRKKTTGSEAWNSTNVIPLIGVKTTYKVDYKNTQWFIDDGTSHSGTFDGRAGNSYQNCVGMSWGSRSTLANVHNVKWYRDDAMILDIIPVVASNTPYFYDKVNETLLPLDTPVNNVVVGPKVTNE